MTTPINLSVFMQALSAAGLASVAVSFGSDGTVTFGPDVTAAQKIAVEALLAQHNPVTAGLLTYASAARFNLETGGVTINGMLFPTDRQTQAQLSGAATAALNNPSFSTMWKLPTGQFVQLGAPAIIAAANRGCSCRCMLCDGGQHRRADPCGDPFDHHDKPDRCRVCGRVAVSHG